MDYKEIVKKLCAYPKGILAADEKTSTIGKRFANINVENNVENRMEYRSLLFETEDLEKYLSGVITFDETFESIYEDYDYIFESFMDVVENQYQIKLNQTFLLDQQLHLNLVYSLREKYIY